MEILQKEIVGGITVLHGIIAIVLLVVARNILIWMSKTKSQDSGPMVARKCKACEWNGRIGMYVKKCPKCGLAL